MAMQAYDAKAERLKIFRKNFRWARQRFREMPFEKWVELKAAARFGPNYYYWKNAGDFAKRVTSLNASR